MNDEELMLLLCEALEKLEVVDVGHCDDAFLLNQAVERIREVRDQLRYGLGDI